MDTAHKFNLEYPELAKEIEGIILRQDDLAVQMFELKALFYNEINKTKNDLYRLRKLVNDILETDEWDIGNSFHRKLVYYIDEIKKANNGKLY